MRPAALLLVTLAFVSTAAHGAAFASIPTRDAFVATGPTGNLSGNNYGGGGGVSVSAPGLPQGEFQSVLQFDLAAAAASFDTTFGAGQWSLSSATLTLTATAANNAIFNAPAAGQLAISWMQNDSWLEGSGTPGSPGGTGITYTTLQSTFIGAGDQSLGTFAFTGATSGAFPYALGLSSGLVADALAGSALSVRLFAADAAVSGVFNSRSFVTVANRPVLTLVAVPEPDSLALGAFGLSLLAAARRARTARPRA
jgi:PEP-CTERM motif-containing protein